MGRPRKVPVEVVKPVAETSSAAQEMAMRIWRGQSVSLSRKERVRRIESALAGHDFSADEIAGISLPE